MYQWYDGENQVVLMHLASLLKGITSPSIRTPNLRVVHGIAFQHFLVVALHRW